MIEQEIIEGDKLIAEFMGGEFITDGTGKGLNHIRFKNDPKKDGKLRFFAIEDLKYHSSWDWQIPAWAKLVTLCQQLVTAKKDRAKFESARDSYYRFLDRYEQAVCTNNPLVGFKVFNETLKWYNENK